MVSLSIEENSHLREVSFSSYLNPSEEAFLKKLAETSKISTSKTVAIKKDNADIGSIDVFEADKYFRDAIEEGTIDHLRVKNNQSSLSPLKVIKTQARTPSIRSESSWNSQSGLLQRDQKSLFRNKNAKRRLGKSLVSTLGCYCSCGDENSVDVDMGSNEIVSKIYGSEGGDLKKNGNLGIRSNEEDCFTFPITNSKTENLQLKQVFREEGHENKRNSLDVFNLESELDLFTIDTNPSREEIDGLDQSDSSSDLFEIESFKVTNNSNYFLYRQASSGCLRRTTCYTPPSEASVENLRKTVRVEKEKEAERMRWGIFSGCTSQKAIEVVGSLGHKRIE